MANRPDDVLPDSPYPGLNFFEYTKQDYNVFAGRDDDVFECNAKLHDVRVLVLHGRTGCGKSSFLRAGLKPRLDLTGLLAQTTGKGDGEGLQILRTGARPLTTVAKAFYDFVARIGTDIKPKAGRRTYAKVSDILEGQSEAEFLVAAGESPARLLRAIIAMEAAVPGIEPVFVLDQAEEMWTLAKRVGADDVQTSDKVSDKEARRQRDLLFKFILELPAKTEFVRFIFSMRTEYKGQFDDELATLSLQVPQHVGGYYLGELTRRHLLAAILKPTSQADVLDSGISPYSKYKFEYDEEVPGRLVDALLDEKSGTPRGGVLPVLQVACLRLYETTRKEAEAEERQTWSIKTTHFDQLGQIHKQIELFVQERLEQALRENGHPWSEVLQEVEGWYRLLNDQLVSVESDGRVTTRKVETDDLDERGRALGLRAFSDARKEPGYNCGDKILARLKESNILRVEERPDKSEWSLGHDSVGLAINRWSQIYAAQFQLNPRTELASAVSAGNVTRLYDEEDSFERFRLFTTSENVWDQMTIQYAEEKGFAKRLGLDIEIRQELDINSDNVTSDEVTRALNGLQEGERAAYLIARPRHLFPDKDLLRSWIDVSITNAYQGYGLIGPKGIADTEQVAVLRRDLVDTAAGGSFLDKADKNREKIKGVYDRYCDSIASLMKYIEKKDSRIWLFDDVARDFLSLSLQLGGRDPGEVSDFLQRHASMLVESDAGGSVRVGDRLFNQLLENPEHFMVGTAVGRAHSVRRGLQTYVEVQDLSDLIEMMVPAKSDRRKDKRLRADLLDRQLKTQSHVTWQLGISQEMIDDERIEPLLYRVAALGYYTSEYIRSNPDDFVRYLDSQLQKLSPPGTFRLDRESIRESMRACYVWPSFDQYAPQFLDRGSDMVYWQEDNKTSKAREIYFKMVSYRTRFLDEFRQYNSQYIRLSDGAGADKDAQTTLTDRLKEAENLRDLAWDNYRVLNFYDAYRTMSRARLQLREAQREIPHTALRSVIHEDL
jgi:energy-coupling factor transporter ATP-binding protein EcfA2